MRENPALLGGHFGTRLSLSASRFHWPPPRGSKIPFFCSLPLLFVSLPRSARIFACREVHPPVAVVTPRPDLDVAPSRLSPRLFFFPNKGATPWIKPANEWSFWFGLALIFPPAPPVDLPSFRCGPRMFRTTGMVSCGLGFEVFELFA